MKVLENFICNGIHGAKGNILSEADLDQIGDMCSQLIKDGLLEALPKAEKKPQVEEQPKVEEKKKGKG